MPKRPLVNTAIRTEFGDVLEDPSFHDVAGVANDLTYVPGFSEMRRDRDLELAAVASGAKPRHEAKLTPLPVNVRWTRNFTPKGAPDGRKQITSGNLGYRAVTKADIGQHDWLKALPPGATLNADGTIQKGDTMLTVTDGKTAGRNVARRAVQTQRMIDVAKADAAGLLGAGAHESYIRKEPAAAAAAGGA